MFSFTYILLLRFYSFYQIGENEEDLMDVDIFDQSYRSIVETDANKILDVERLKELLPISTYKKSVEIQ